MNSARRIPVVAHTFLLSSVPAALDDHAFSEM